MTVPDFGLREIPDELIYGLGLDCYELGQGYAAEEQNAQAAWWVAVAALLCGEATRRSGSTRHSRERDAARLVECAGLIEREARETIQQELLQAERDYDSMFVPLFKGLRLVLQGNRQTEGTLQ